MATNLITKAELQTLAQSPKADDRKRAFQIYQYWVKNADKLSPLDRLNAMERHMLEQIFASKGMKTQPTLGKKPPSRTSVPSTGRK